jgi:hypothetical protein
MRILFSSFSFLATMVIGAIAFAFTALEFPGIMNDLMAYAQSLPAYLKSLGLSDSYMVWVNILITGEKLVLLGFILAARIVLSIITSIVAPIFEPAPTSASYAREEDGSAFNGWGRSRR